MMKNSRNRAISGALLALVTVGALGVAVAPAAQADRHNKPPTCTATNGNNVATADFTTVHSPLVLPGSIGCSSRNRVMDQFSKVSVVIHHTCLQVLNVWLVAPDGSTYFLPDQNTCTGPPASDTFSATFTVNLSSEQHTGTWQLRAQDTDGFSDVGFIDTWTLTSPASTPAP